MPKSFVVLVLSELAAPLRAIGLQSATLDAWQNYVRDAGVRVQARLDAKERFMWIAESVDRAQRARRGEVVRPKVSGFATSCRGFDTHAL